VIDVIEMFDSGKAAPKLHADVRKLAGRWLGDAKRIGVSVDDIR
jgi:hypothetical protein